MPVFTPVSRIKAKWSSFWSAQKSLYAGSQEPDFWLMEMHARPLKHLWTTPSVLRRRQWEHPQTGRATKHLQYDKKARSTTTSSALLLRVWASQPDAALYYLARMIETGEDPKFIARRMVIFASEDVGLAQPTALVVATKSPVPWKSSAPRMRPQFSSMAQPIWLSAKDAGKRCAYKRLARMFSSMVICPYPWFSATHPPN